MDACAIAATETGASSARAVKAPERSAERIHPTMKQKHTNIRACLAAGIALFLCGCITRNPEMTSGTFIEPAKVSQIVKGKTTRAEIEALFGKPDMTSMLPDGRRVVSYNYSSSRFEVNSGYVLKAAFTASGALAKGKTHTQGLQIYVSKEGVVEDFEFSDNSRDIQSFGDGSMKTTNR
jgi:outer membrane protein assembly factor BamE (lipoprotein component of BamABCDE complex)